MAFAVRNVNVPTEENGGVLGMKDTKAGIVKGASLLQQGSKRRAPLCDVSNLAGPLNNRNATLGKDGKAVDAKPKVVAKPKPAAEAPPSAGSRPNSAGSGLIPRTRSQTLAARQQTVGGLSMSSLLDSRSSAINASSQRSLTPASPLPDIDSADLGNCLAETGYVSDIYNYYRRVENKYRVAPAYMGQQADINEKMRAILVDWLVEVHLKFKLMPESLYLTVNLIDRFLEQKQVTRKNLQLVGVTAMLIASKYEEIWAPEVRDFVYISDKAYTREQILSMEKMMLNTLKFSLTLPTTHQFQARFLKAAGVQNDKPLVMLSNYLLELSLVDSNMLKHSYSAIAAASVHVAMTAFDKPDDFPNALARHSNYSKAALLPVSAQLVQLMQKAPTASLSAVHKKYSHVKLMEITKTPVPLHIMEEAVEQGVWQTA